nr:hypothetical protein CFP56_64702 [Quercus suber]
MADDGSPPPKYDSDVSDDLTDQTHAKKADGTIPVTLVLQHAYLHKREPDSDLVQMIHAQTDAKMTRRIPFALPEAITYAELMKVLSAQVQTHFAIDLKAYNTENGGQGVANRVECEIDLEGAGKRRKGWMTMTTPNEEAWQAAKGLMRVAKGETEILWMFAVKDNKLLNLIVRGCVVQ